MRAVASDTASSVLAAPRFALIEAILPHVDTQRDLFNVGPVCLCGSCSRGTSNTAIRRKESAIAV